MAEPPRVLQDFFQYLAKLHGREGRTTFSEKYLANPFIQLSEV
jgi:hypothetical protein